MLGIWHINAVGDTEGKAQETICLIKELRKITKAAKWRMMPKLHAKEAQDGKRGEIK